MEIASSPVYLDASALAKIYVWEFGSDALEVALAGRRDLMISDLAVTEVVSAMARRAREQHLSQTQMNKAYRRLMSDVTQGRFLRVMLTARGHRTAERLVFELGDRVALRAADALHVALAALAGAHALVTFGRRMAAAARVIGAWELVD